jgi:hypothetical protein
MKSWPAILVSLGVAILLASSCADERPTRGPAELREGILKLYIVDSFHINDSTASFAAQVEYGYNHPSGFFSSGTFEIGALSSVGMVHELLFERTPAGEYAVHFAVSRPYVIIGRKDDTSDARFAETVTAFVPANYFGEAAEIDIWAYRLNRLVVYFDPNLTLIEADNIINESGAEILRRSRSLFDNALFYRISTEGAGTEIEVKDELGSAPGVRSVLFDIFGHSYF